MKTMTTAFLCLVALFALPAQAATFCVSPAGGSCSMTIQAAVDTAAATALATDEVHTIAIKPGTYKEAVTVANDTELDGLIIKGSAKSIIDPAATGNPGLTISAPNVTVTGLSVNNIDDDGINVTDSGDNITITKVSINNATADCIDLQTDVDGATLTGNKFFKCGDAGIEMQGDNSTISKNKFNEVNGTAITVDGTFSTIESNLCISTDECVTALTGGDNNLTLKKNKALVQSGSNNAFQVVGNDALFEGNTGVGLGFAFITVNGEDPQVLANKSKEAFGGISVTCATDCDAVLVERNSQTNLQSGTCIALNADDSGAVVQNNTCKQVSAGYTMAGDGAETMQSNKLVNSKNDAFAASTPMATSIKSFIKNTATYAGGDGFDVNGLAATTVAHVIQDNKATKGAQDGFNFNVDTNGMAVTGNTATNNIQEGFEHRGGGTSPNNFNENKASNNRSGSDFCNDGGTTDSLTDNDFDTTTTTCEF